MSDTQGTITAEATDAVDSAEQSKWEMLEKEQLGDDPESEEPELEAKEEPEAVEKVEEKTEAEAEKADKPLPYEELDKRHKQLQGALGEERAQRRRLAEQHQQMRTVIETIMAQRQAGTQPEAPKVPTLEEDPIGYFQHKIAAQEAEIQRLNQGTQQTQEQFVRQQREQQFWSSVQRSEAEMRAINPDYDPAVTFLEESRIKELELMIPDSAQAYAEQQGYQSPEALRMAILNHDRVNVANQALQMGVAPAQLYYQLAQQRGYRPAPPAQAAPQILKKATAQATPITATKAGMAASKSLSGGVGGTSNVMTAEDLAQLYLDDPDKADKEFSRMKKAGLLG